MMQTAAVQKISEQNSPYKAMLDRAYMIGYTDAMNQERSHRRAARERRERKKYFAMQKLNGVALLIFTAVAIKILEGDATIAFITVPLGLTIVGNNQAGFTIAFAKDSETVIDAEFKAQPMDKEGTLILYTEDIDKTE